MSFLLDSALISIVNISTNDTISTIQRRMVLIRFHILKTLKQIIQKPMKHFKFLVFLPCLFLHIIVNGQVLTGKIYDTCVACKEIEIAAIRGSVDSTKLYLTSCVNMDTLKYDVSYKDTVLLTVLSVDKCTNDSSLQFLFIDIAKQRIIAFHLPDSDKQIDKFPLEFPDFTRPPKDRIVCDIVDELPIFPGGQDGLEAYIKANMQYPAMASQYGIQGVSYIRFEIDEAGQISSDRIDKGIGGGCDEEARRLVKKMPKWVPAVRSGVPVKVSYQLPVVFKIE